MQHGSQAGRRATRAAFIAAACWALVPVLAVLPSHPPRAQDAGNGPQPTREQVDQQITSLLDRIETLVDEGHVTSPAGGNAAELFSQVLILSASASPSALQTMAHFPNVLKQRADAEHAAGHTEASVRFEVFSQVAASIIASQQGPDGHSATAAAAQAQVDTPHPADLATRQTAASATSNTDEAAGRTTGARPVPNPPAAGTPANTVALAIQPGAQNQQPTANSPFPVAPPANTADTSLKAAPSPPPAPAVTRQSAPPTAPGGPPAQPNAPQPNAARADEASSTSEPAKIATLQPPMTANGASARDHPETKAPALTPPLSPSMIDAILKQGEAMLSIGDISAARLLFTRAAESGSARAAIELGDTYNPVVLAERGVLGPQGDADLAKAWYRKALAFGEPQARQRLIDLGAGAQPAAVGVLSKR